MEPNLLQREDKKYSELWKNGYNDANWKRLANIVIKEQGLGKNLPLIDLGFGKGTAMEFFEEKGYDVSGVEVSKYAVENQKKKKRIVFHSTLDGLKIFRDNRFKIGFCNDVIEHVPEHLIISSLKEISRICSNYLYISICPTPAHHKSLEGEQLHLTIQPREWWEENLKQFGEIKKYFFPFSRSLRYRVKLS